MSAAPALVKFKKTGHIYFACYEGTSDTIIPFICTPEECYNEKFDCYCVITYCRDLDDRRHKELGYSSWIFPDNVSDLDEVEIYSDYGSGFYWTDGGSESLRMLKLAINECGELIMRDEEYGMPDWAKEFFESLERN